MLSFYVTAGVLVGFEASGHISEETKDASLTAARGIFSSAVVSGVLGFPVVILFLYCTPDIDTLYSFGAPQPFVNLYALTMGMGGHIFMNIVCILGLMFNTTVAGVASSRLIWAVARDGVLPGSSWISQVSKNKEPRNAVITMHAVAALLLCTILPSGEAFESLVSAAAVPTITAYALICFGRTFITPGEFKNARWSLGKFSWPFSLIAFVWNTYLAAVLISPLEFPVTGENFNCRYLFSAHVVLALTRDRFTRHSWWHHDNGSFDMVVHTCRVVASYCTPYQGQRDRRVPQRL